MYLKTLTLRQFRSHRDLDLSLDPGVNLFLGMNGAGKTNLLEALAVLATGTSPRGADLESMVEWGQSGLFIQGTFGFEDPAIDPYKLEVKIQTGSPRTIRENGQGVIRIKDLLGKVPLVSFVPEDLSLVKGEPDIRRQALNMILMQVDPLYAATLRRYGEIVRSRNAALRQVADGALSQEAIEPWDESLIEAGLELCEKRDQFLKDFSPRVARVHERITGGQETAEMIYQPSVVGPWDESAKTRWREKIKELRERETALGYTLFGPQRDEIIFNLNGKPARSFASEGQKRTCAVAFKLAEIPYIQEKTGQKPICLLDDVLSELDAARAEHLLDELSRTGQCLVTLTGLEAWPRHRNLPASIFRVDSSGVRRDSSLEHLSRSKLALAN